MTTAKEILIAARGYITKGWCQMASARDEEGKSCYFGSVKACSWCSSGAITRANHDIYKLDILAWDASLQQVYKVLESILGEKIVPWNDADNRTQADVLELFDRAIASLETT